LQPCLREQSLEYLLAVYLGQQHLQHCHFWHGGNGVAQSLSGNRHQLWSSRWIYQTGKAPFLQTVALVVVWLVEGLALVALRGVELGLHTPRLPGAANFRTAATVLLVTAVTLRRPHTLLQLCLDWLQGWGI
jgi:hypothetical protein